MQVLQESADGTIEHRTPPVAQHGEVVAMRIPGAVGARFRFRVGPGGPVDLNEAHAGLDKATGKQAALAELRHAEALARGHRLAVEAKSAGGAIGFDQREGLVVIGVESGLADLSARRQRRA